MEVRLPTRTQHSSLISGTVLADISLIVLGGAALSHFVGSSLATWGWVAAIIFAGFIGWIGTRAGQVVAPDPAEVPNRSRLAAIITYSDDAIISKTLDGQIQSWNDAAVGMFGYTSEEAIGRPITMLLPPDKLDEETRILITLHPVDAKTSLDTAEVPLLDSNKTPATNNELRRLTAMVVDDERDAREFVRRLLESHGSRVSVASSAEHVIELLQGAIPDALPCDIGMPGQDGYELIRRIRAREPEMGGRIPAAALSALARPEDRARALLEGYQMHLAKPADAEQLVRTVATLAGRPAGPE